MHLHRPMRRFMTAPLSHRILFFLLLGSTLLPFCKTSQATTDAPKPPEQYGQTEEVPFVSTLTIPISIGVDELVRSLNKKMSGALYEDYSYTDNDNDGLMLNAWKSQELTLRFSGNTLKYRVPIKLWMKKKLPLGEAEAEANIALGMKTTYRLNEDWSLSTQTEVEFHEWISKPVLKTGLGDINIEPIANVALNRSKKMLTQSIDDYITQQLSLKPFLQEAWTAIQEPVLLSEEYKMWTKTTPVSVAMTPLAADSRNIRAKVSVECYNDVTFGDKPKFRENANLPNLRYIEDAPDDFVMQFATDVPYPEAERMAKATMVGQVFESGKYKVRVEDIQLWGNNDKLVVNSKLSGSFNGNVYFMGKPRFNAAKNQIEVADLDFHVDTRNFLYKSASWMFQGTFKKKMAAAMAFPLDENIAELKKSVQASLANYEVQPGILLRGALDSVAVQGTHLTPTAIRVNLFSKGKVNVDVKGL